MKLLSVNFWLGAFINTFITIVCLYAIKKVTAKVDIPVVSDMVQEV